MERKRGTFVVTHADDATAVLRDAEDGQVHTMQENPDVTAGDVIEATVEPAPPTGTAWEVIEVDERRTVSVERSGEPPTRHERDVAADQAVGELTRVERAGTGELHVLTVPEDHVEAAVSDVLDDEEGLLARAARLGIGRVEVRAVEVDPTDGQGADGDGEAAEKYGVVSVRYLP